MRVFVGLGLLILGFMGCGGSGPSSRLLDSGQWGPNESPEEGPFIYVSPTGSDLSNGSKDHPFKTIAHAQAEARKYLASNSKPITVRLRAGRYELSEALVFDSRDSGTSSQPSIYEAEPGEEVILSGGQELTEPRIQTANPRIVKIQTHLKSLYQMIVNSRPATRARHPNLGMYFRLRSWDLSGKTVRISNDSLPANVEIAGLEFIPQTSWTDHRLQISQVQRSNTETLLSFKAEQANTFFYYGSLSAPPLVPGAPFHFENALQFVDSPGEWFFDSKTGELTYYLREDENISSLSIRVPLVDTLVRISGTQDLRVHDFLMRGLRFEDTTWKSPFEKGYVGFQGGTLRSSMGLAEMQKAALEIENAENVRVERNVFRNLGGAAIHLKSGTSRSQIRGNQIYQVSGMGIVVGGDSLSEYNPSLASYDLSRISSEDLIENNWIHSIGREYVGSAAILTGWVRKIQISHNEISKTPYSGISLGWGWTAQRSLMESNSVTSNRISNVMNLLDDGGGIYTLSAQPGSIIRGNEISNLVRSMFAWVTHIAGLYFDQGSSGFEIKDNILNVHEQMTTNQASQSTQSVLSGAVIDRAGLTSEFSDIRIRPMKRFAFGGMYSMPFRPSDSVSFQGVVNPITSQYACPANYESKRILGRAGASGFVGDGELYVCIRELAASEEAEWDFGGIFGGRYDFSNAPELPAGMSGNHTFYANPALGYVSDHGCSKDFIEAEAMNHIGYDYPVRYCYRAHKKDSKDSLLFGGILSASSGDGECPIGFERQMIYGAFYPQPSIGRVWDFSLIDEPMYLCYSSAL